MAWFNDENYDFAWAFFFHSKDEAIWCYWHGSRWIYENSQPDFFVQLLLPAQNPVYAVILMYRGKELSQLDAGQIIGMYKTHSSFRFVSSRKTGFDSFRRMLHGHTYELYSSGSYQISSGIPDAENLPDLFKELHPSTWQKKG
jgi:hypothetical protein